MNMGLFNKFSKNKKTKQKESKNLSGAAKKELNEELGENKKQIVGQAKSIRKLWKSHEVLQYKSDAIALLFKKRGYGDEFITEFEKLTQEGYQLVLLEPVKAIDAGPIDMQIGNFYYFQKGQLIK